MSTQNYGLLREGAGNAVVRPIPLPKLRENYVLIRTVAIALNPTDWTTLDANGDDGTIAGCDFAGIVEEVGSAVTKSFKKGDKVTGLAHGANDEYPEDGAFARYITTKGDLLMHVPDGISLEAASAVSCAIGTIGYGLHYILGVPFPDQDVAKSGEPILIYGGSTATGSMAIQFAKLFRNAAVGKRIRQDTNGKITKVFDTVGLDSSAAICADAIGPSGGTHCTLLPVETFRKDVESIFFLGYDITGESYKFEGESYPAKPELFEWTKKFTTLAEKLWAEGKWQPHPQSVREGGLLGAVEGMNLMREGKGPSGEKWVYRVDDTKWPQENELLGMKREAVRKLQADTDDTHSPGPFCLNLAGEATRGNIETGLPLQEKLRYYLKEMKLLWNI
ncbi:hypothetical protein LTR97_008205 [Elasticomyces elasticus]|uniref:Enoyl reductase (ER) domain-containing protein n=1 Tax=Elasticomyces elasticus TaxID=574655 RepID=A0AAN7W3G1_9PEZI|nr:hypothetical protein LTR97_008205 [Elasticomyces elasticus]